MPPSTAAAARTIAYDMEVDIFSPEEVLTYTDSDRHCTYIKGSKHRSMLSQPVNSIFDKLDVQTQCNTPIVNCAKAISKGRNIMNIDMSLDIYGPSTTITVSLDRDHDRLGFIFHSDLRTPTIQECAHGTPPNSIEQWRSRFRNATIRALNGEIIDTMTQFQHQINVLRASATPDCMITLAHEDFGNLHTAQGLPKMHFDQLQEVDHHLNCIKYGDD